MNKEYTYLLHLLNSFVNEKIPDKPEDIHWGKLKELADIHCVSGILGFMVYQYKLCSSSEMTDYFRKNYMAGILMFTRRAAYMEQLIQEMNQEEIDHLVFKGYVVKDYYPVPELRTYGDIDFAIRRKDRKKSCDLMERLGYGVKTDWEPVYSYYKNSEFYEIHTDIMEVNVSDKADYQEYFSHMWEHAVKKDGCTWELAPEYHFLFLLTHIAKHICGSGAGVRMYLDIAVFIRHFGGSIDWKYICRELHTLNLYDFCCVVLTAVRDWFGVESPMEIQPVSEKIMNDFFVYTLEAGVFGYVDREQGVNALKRNEKEERKISRFSTLIRRLFPDASSLEKRYTYLINRHWLLPVAWVHRFFRTRESWGKHAHEARVIMSADSREVARLRKIYKDIGL